MQNEADARVQLLRPAEPCELNSLESLLRFDFVLIDCEACVRVFRRRTGHRPEVLDPVQPKCLRWRRCNNLQVGNRKRGMSEFVAQRQLAIGVGQYDGVALLRVGRQEAHSAFPVLLAGLGVVGAKWTYRTNDERQHQGVANPCQTNFRQTCSYQQESCGQTKEQKARRIDRLPGGDQQREQDR